MSIGTVILIVLAVVTFYIWSYEIVNRICNCCQSCATAKSFGVYMASEKGDDNNEKSSIEEFMAKNYQDKKGDK